MWQAWFNIAAGLWLILCAFVPPLQTPASMIIPGIVSIIFGFWGGGSINSWQGYINGIIGIWLFISAVWLMLYVPWNFFIAGIVVVALALWNSLEHVHPQHAHVH
jgi:hypothetical protein